MKILCFIRTLNQGGAERVMSILANELSARGYQITIVTDIQSPLAYEIREQICIRDLYENIRNLKGFFQKLALHKHIRSIVREESPDVIISFMYGLTYKVLISLIGMKVPIISSEHACFHNLKDCSFSEYIKRFWINKLATVVTVLTRRDYDFIGKRLKHKVVMPNPVSFDVLQDNSHERIKGIMACGSIDRYEIKGFDRLIRIWGKLAKNYPDWHVDIIGGGNEKNMNYVKNLIEESGLSDKIKLLGASNDIKNLMRKYPIFALTSRIEGFSLVLVEAMSQGCTCISFDCEAGPREIINKDIDGILVPDNDEEMFAKQLSRLIENKELREKLSSNAINHMQRFSKENIVNKWESLISNIVNNK